eukprot:GHRQ01037522.1.p1 GENE.GHRQ01037522.1~~GHRQ01037522.1.p1  ORF type:complete len:129 (+),score=0.24 GHRQ01037522.1:368-754(+)
MYMPVNGEQETPSGVALPLTLQSCGSQTRMLPCHHWRRPLHKSSAPCLSAHPFLQGDAAECQVTRRCGAGKLVLMVGAVEGHRVLQGAALRNAGSLSSAQTVHCLSVPLHALYGQQHALTMCHDHHRG